jgi:hypothetical protein
MSVWRLNNKNEVQHTNGYRLRLGHGTWKEPEDIHPSIPKTLDLSPLESIRFMREGLYYASEITATVDSESNV